MKGKGIKIKKRSWLLLAAFLLALALSVGMTVAYMFAVTPPKTNEFRRAVVSCEVDEIFDHVAGEKSSIKVQNTGNIYAYLRVRLVSYWVDSDGKIIAKPGTVPTFTLNSGWESKGNNIYLYTQPIAPEAYTPNLLADGQKISLATETDGSRQVIEVFAEAIQSNALSEWSN